MVETREQRKARKLVRDIDRARAFNVRNKKNIDNLDMRIKALRKKYERMKLKK
jgi:hypothetical protein